jgi:hypothetical protein
MMAQLRHTALNLLRLAGHRRIAARLRHHGRHPAAVLPLLGLALPENAFALLAAALVGRRLRSQSRSAAADPGVSAARAAIAFSLLRRGAPPPPGTPAGTAGENGASNTSSG